MCAVQLTKFSYVLCSVLLLTGSITCSCFVGLYISDPGKVVSFLALLLDFISLAMLLWGAAVYFTQDFGCSSFASDTVEIRYVFYATLVFWFVHIIIYIVLINSCGKYQRHGYCLIKPKHHR